MTENEQNSHLARTDDADNSHNNKTDQKYAENRRSDARAPSAAARKPEPEPELSSSADVDLSRFRGTAGVEGAFSKFSGLSALSAGPEPQNQSELVENPERREFASSGVQAGPGEVEVEAARTVELSDHSAEVGASKTQSTESDGVPEQPAGAFQRSVVRRTSLGVSRAGRASERPGGDQSRPSESAKAKVERVAKGRRAEQSPAFSGSEDAYNVTRAGRLRPRVSGRGGRAESA